MMESAIDKQRFTVVMKADNQQLERDDNTNRYVVTDGWKTDWIIFYDHKPKWANDGVFSINKNIREKLHHIARQHYQSTGV